MAKVNRRFIVRWVIITLFVIEIFPVLIGNNKMIFKKYNRIEISTPGDSEKRLITDQKEIEEFRRCTSKINFRVSFAENKYDYIISFYNDSDYVTSLFYDSVTKTFKVNMGMFLSEVVSQKVIDAQFDDLIQKYIG